jgi:predicted metal-dependent peptidase
MTNQLPIEARLSRARTQLLLNHPFFGTLCLRLKLEPCAMFPTMATDGRRLVYNPAFVETLTPAELEGVLAHEVMHCALAHHCRRGERDARLWNHAADYAINPILIGNGMSLPNDALIDPQFTDLGAEEIYARLSRQKPGSDTPQSQPQSDDQSNGGGAGAGVARVSGAGTQQAPATARPEPQREDPATSADPGGARDGGFGEVLDVVGDDGKRASEAELSRQTHEWAIAAEQALRSAKACGCEPGGVERPLQEARESKQDWRAILRDFISATTPSDYHWSPPNRRFVSSGLYLPSVERSGVGEVVIVVDTSGSIGGQELQQFAGEINAIVSEAQPQAIHVIYCDAEIQGVEEFGPSELIGLLPKGGGGTDFIPPFRWVEEQGLEPKCLIYLTDLCCQSFPEAPEYPVLWATDSRKSAPFGETVFICA